jgi:hypothetical protein
MFERKRAFPSSFIETRCANIFDTVEFPEIALTEQINFHCPLQTEAVQVSKFTASFEFLD